jgi:Putative Actinobacterial Holin-X, holin superfamily III
MPINNEASPSSEATIGELVAKLSEQTTRLVRDEVRLAQAEMAQKGKKAGLGAGQQLIRSRR